MRKPKKTIVDFIQMSPLSGVSYANAVSEAAVVALEEDVLVILCVDGKKLTIDPGKIADDILP